MAPDSSETVANSGRSYRSVSRRFAALLREPNVFLCRNGELVEERHKHQALPAATKLVPAFQLPDTQKLRYTRRAGRLRWFDASQQSRSHMAG
jgi:hypothetical protein